MSIHKRRNTLWHVLFPLLTMLAKRTIRKYAMAKAAFCAFCHYWEIKQIDVIVAPCQTILAQILSVLHQFVQFFDIVKDRVRAGIEAAVIKEESNG